MKDDVQKILSLCQERISDFIEQQDPRYEWPEKFFKQIVSEVEESKAEYRDNNQVYLEDELGDIFHALMMLYSSCAAEGKISSVENVFKRCCKKFSERHQGDWGEVKKKQKIALQEEHQKLYENK